MFYVRLSEEPRQTIVGFWMNYSETILLTSFILSSFRLNSILPGSQPVLCLEAYPRMLSKRILSENGYNIYAMAALTYSVNKIESLVVMSVVRIFTWMVRLPFSLGHQNSQNLVAIDIGLWFKPDAFVYWIDYGYLTKYQFTMDKLEDWRRISFCQSGVMSRGLTLSLQYRAGSSP